jgi:recombination protein RecT
MSNLPEQKKTEITDKVLKKLELMQGAGEIRLPENYSAENALKSAQLYLSEQLTKDNKPVLEACTTVSIANALLKMVVQGLSVVKNQCYFIAYGNKLNFQRSYFGSVALAKRVSNVTDVVPVVIYDGDEFELGIDIDTGYRKVLKHVPAFQNIDNAKIKGAYAIVHKSDGTKQVEVMTIAEIEQAWQQGTTKGASPAHKNFRQEMAKKTVINRACKEPINTSDDAHLYFNEDYEEAPKGSVQSDEIIDFEEVKTEVKSISIDESTPEPPKEQPKKTEAIDFPESN